MHGEMPKIRENLSGPLPAALTSVSDLRNLIRFLKKRRDGISALELTDIYLRRMFEPHKLSAYSTWGIIASSDSVIRLTPLGLRIAQALDAEALEFREIVDSIAPYRQALEWISTHEDRIIRYDQVSEFWDRNFPGVFTSSDLRSRENCVINFFHLCHIAGFGTAAVGRKGQPTRFTVDPEDLAAFLNDRESPHYAPPAVIPPTQRNEGSVAVFCSDESDLSVPFREIMTIADLQIVPCIRKPDETAVSPSCRKILSNCRSAIVTSNDSGGFETERLIIELATASVMFDSKVLLVWQGSAPPRLPFADLPVIRISPNPTLREALEFGKLIKSIGL